MTETYNPYAPPEAAVADVPLQDGAAFQPVKVLGAKGRIGRMRYVAYLFGAGFIMNVVMSVLGTILGVVTMFSVLDSGQSPGAMNGPPAAVIGMSIAFWVIWLIICVLWTIFYVRATMQRGHDLNLSGWFTLLTFIPFVNLYWAFAPGSKGANRYGPPPEPNSTGVQVVFWIGIGLSVLAMLVAILLITVALASYKDYQGRARQQQHGSLQMPREHPATPPGLRPPWLGSPVFG
jgi:uncharacterized membrane protein YhaH (DUF805 family)